jgi:CRISPR/Cas system-associated exonuclease Cas4 (RecB family)
VPVTISGKYDFLTYNTTTNTYIVTDLKTTKNLYYINTPSPEYVKQVRFYAYLNSLSQAQLLYIDFGDAKKFQIEVGNIQPLLDELEEKAQQLYIALTSKTPPPKETGWLCDYCEYQTMCNNNDSNSNTDTVTEAAV